MQRYRQRTLKITREEVGVTEGSQALPRTPTLSASLPPPTTSPVMIQLAVPLLV